MTAIIPSTTHPVELGARFGRLVVIGEAPSAEDRRRRVFCDCDCGSRAVIVRAKNLSAGLTQSCGCLARYLVREASVKHGESPAGGRLKSSPEYRVWVAMRQRCRDPNHIGFKYYGGRGVVVCERWLKYENFLADMGRKPSPQHSIDRIDGNGDYEPGNCRWATRKEQINNRR